MPKIARCVRAGWNRRDDVVRCRLKQTFVVDEEERLVIAVIKLRNAKRAADLSAKQVVPVLWPPFAEHVVEMIIRVQNLVAEVPICRSVIIVRSRIGTQSDNCAGGAAVLGGVRGCQHLELSNGVRGRKCLWAARRSGHNRNTVDQKFAVQCTAAIDRQLRGTQSTLACDVAAGRNPGVKASKFRTLRLGKGKFCTCDGVIVVPSEDVSVATLPNTVITR